MVKYLLLVILFFCIKGIVVAGPDTTETTGNCSLLFNQYNDYMMHLAQIAEGNPEHCIQPPIPCTKNSDCKCSGCCSQLVDGLTVCQMSCWAHHDFRATTKQISSGL